MKICEICKGEIHEDNETYCNVCGGKLVLVEEPSEENCEDVCVHCGAKLKSSNAKFCTRCGNKVEQVSAEVKSKVNTCPQCGVELKDTKAKFCVFCGMKLDEEKKATTEISTDSEVRVIPEEKLETNHVDEQYAENGLEYQQAQENWYVPVHSIELDDEYREGTVNNQEKTFSAKNNAIGIMVMGIIAVVISIATILIFDVIYVFPRSFEYVYRTYSMLGIEIGIAIIQTGVIVNLIKKRD